MMDDDAVENHRELYKQTCEGGIKAEFSEENDNYNDAEIAHCGENACKSVGRQCKAADF